jgi:hypothetical protein
MCVYGVDRWMGGGKIFEIIYIDHTIIHTRKPIIPLYYLLPVSRIVYSKKTSLKNSGGSSPSLIP